MTDYCGIATVARYCFYFGFRIEQYSKLKHLISFFTSNFHILCAFITSLTVFIFASAFKRKYIEHGKIVEHINNYFDAIGLGIFSVTGAKICMDSGFDSALVAISLGMITGVGGGMIRDLCLREIPFVFNKRIYAVASIIGAFVYFVLLKFSCFPEYFSFLIGVFSVVVIRILATIFHLNMPKAIVYKNNEAKNLKDFKDAADYFLKNSYNVDIDYDNR